MPPNLGGFFMVRSYYPSECHADYFDFERIERSEERFSRNAETDLVCRLLLEKKNTSTVACSHLERALRSAPGTAPGATRAAVLRADGSLHRGRGGARPSRRPARAAAHRRALGVPLVHRARPSSMAPGVSPGR